MVKIDQDYLLTVAKDLLTTPSPSGYCHHVMGKIQKHAHDLDLQFETTKKGAGVITIDGASNDYVVGLSAHVDTLGLMVRSIKSDATLAVTSIGGNLINSLNGSYCAIHTREGKEYTGTIVTTEPSTHATRGAASKGTKAEEIVIRIDEIVKTADDVKALGIMAGDFISIDPKTTVTEAGFIKSRYLDDKISVAIIFALIKAIKDEGLTLKHTLKFFISTYEEVGHGSSYIPEDIDELIAVDMGVIGADLTCTEYDVSICAKDSSGPYDYEMVTEFINIAKKQELGYAVDIYPYYGSDATAALRAGNNIKAALIGPGVHASHGPERTHIDACTNTIHLLYHYLTK
ncbi:M42 family metallopeptidase [Haloplasma contractile]|uniref:Endoglucanase aminopeptidase M42 family protein n=1 Tax=Haloplasma contractile SSD-17B TaxID=1033810 RepID=U2DRI4_9MOLU|nr:M42 family metallopeptidase [Haloplasma contractile]ERJ11187.1 Endoglucanase aminopeptidase M42 family protein [Haloplasma contractile SSD-17B]